MVFFWFGEGGDAAQLCGVLLPLALLQLNLNQYGRRGNRAYLIHLLYLIKLLLIAALR